MSEIHIHLSDPSPETVTAALASLQPPPPPTTITGVKVIDNDQGRRIELAPELRKLLIDFGWLPPVDGE